MRPAISRTRSRPDTRPFRASAQDVRDAINAGAIPGPRLLTSIHQITEKSGAPAKLREMVRQTKAEGGDVIKIFATASIRDGGSLRRSRGAPLLG